MLLLLLVLISLLHNVQSLNFGDPDEDYPWFLALQERQNSSLEWKHFCTAVVLSEKYRLVIMPAHCLFTRGQNGWKDIKVKNTFSYRRKCLIFNFRAKKSYFSFFDCFKHLNFRPKNRQNC